MLMEQLYETVFSGTSLNRGDSFRDPNMMALSDKLDSRDAPKYHTSELRLCPAYAQYDPIQILMDDRPYYKCMSDPLNIFHH
jgi:hypothetical protein